MGRDDIRAAQLLLPGTGLMPAGSQALACIPGARGTSACSTASSREAGSSRVPWGAQTRGLLRPGSTGSARLLLDWWQLLWLVTALSSGASDHVQVPNFCPSPPDPWGYPAAVACLATMSWQEDRSKGLQLLRAVPGQGPIGPHVCTGALDTQCLAAGRSHGPAAWNRTAMERPTSCLGRMGSCRRGWGGT